jgi:hypothetical protein
MFGWYSGLYIIDELLYEFIALDGAVDDDDDDAADEEPDDAVLSDDIETPESTRRRSSSVSDRVFFGPR